MDSYAELAQAADVVALAESVVNQGVASLYENGGPDVKQVLAYDVAHAASAVMAAKVMLHYADLGGDESAITSAFVADVVHDLICRVAGREASWGIEEAPLRNLRFFLERYRSPAFVAALSAKPGRRNLPDELELVQDTFRAFAVKVVAPKAEHVHRSNTDVPEEVISGLIAMGAFGMSVPSAYGGYNEGGSGGFLSMVVATEELSRASLGIGGSLITRPEILARALVVGGTEAQKREWLPKLASGELLSAVAVTEPDYGSDVAGVRVSASSAVGPEGEAGYAINGVKTWCTFAARADMLMLLARTDPTSRSHHGLSLFIVPKPRGGGHGFRFTQSTGGTMDGRAIDTIGYRGMHSYEISFENWWVPATNLIGEADGAGRGFYLQMEGFEIGRLQTAARALGLMQAAYEAALEYAQNRVVFGARVADFELTRVKLGRMVVLIQAGRQFAYYVARLLAAGQGKAEASMIKAFVCRAAEWVTREAMQIHGGYGYAEEFPVSRLYVDARVLSIFEGTDETLCLKVIARAISPERHPGGYAPS